jgi:acetyltransferase-like isoleucine patch superfamily enzyme
MGALRSILKNKVKEWRHSWELNRYGRFTKAAYFRKLGAQVGENCAIIPDSLGTEPWLVKIGDHVTIATGVKFITHDGATWIFREEYPNLQGFGTIIIDDNCVIGEHAILMPNTHIGANSIVGAGSVVMGDVPPNSIVMGVPARVMSNTTLYKDKCLERWEKQRPADVTFAEGETWWNSPHAGENALKLRRHLTRYFWEKPE